MDVFTACLRNEPDPGSTNTSTRTAAKTQGTHEKMSEAYDVFVLGGGLVGLSFALSLQSLGLRVGLAERHVAPIVGSARQRAEGRSLALSLNTLQFFSTLNVLSSLETYSIKSIHISEEGCFGALRLNAAEQQLTELGAVVAARALGEVLYQNLQKNHLFFESETSDFIAEAKGWSFHLKTPKQSRMIHTKLLVAAEGTVSSIRSILGLNAEEEKTGQTAIVANIELSESNPAIAFERFTHMGPMALLPFGARQSTLVWMVPDSMVLPLKSMSSYDFLKTAQKHFGFRAGSFRQLCSDKYSYPITQLQLAEIIGPSVAFIGNSAHTMHPIAGQGFNLAIRGVARLAEEIHKHAATRLAHVDVLLRAYQKTQSHDVERTMLFSKTLQKLFSANGFGAKSLRQSGLLLAEVAPVLKHFLGKLGSGRMQPLPQLVSGMPFGNEQHE